MVYKRSEYGLQFKKSHLVKNVPEYYNHLQYRTHRRELEHAHTPLSWDFEDTSDSKIVTEDDVNDIQLGKLQIQDIPEEGDDNDEDLIKQARDKLQKYENKDNQNTEEDKQLKCKITGTLEGHKGDNSDEKEIKGNPDVQSKDQISNTYVCKDDDLKLNLKENAEKKKSKKLRPKTSERPKSAAIYRPPFMAYGCGDKERETGVKRSFNVRASNDVYPSAMKGLVDLHQRQQKKEKARRCLSARERKRKALVQEKSAKEVAGWQSEYRRMYPQYNPDEYARSASRIQDKPRCFRPYKF